MAKDNKDTVTRLPSVTDQAMSEPDVKDGGQFSRQKGLQFGSLKIAKDRLTADDGTGVVLDISAAGINLYGATGNVFQFYDTLGGTLHGSLGYSTGSSGMILDTTVGLIAITPQTSCIINANTGSISLTAGTDIILTASTSIGINASNGVDIESGSGPFSANGTIVVNSAGAKLAIVETSSGYRSLYCTESPEVWFMDFCPGKKRFKKGWKFWEQEWDLKPDATFLETTEAPYIVMPTGQKDLVQLWGKRKGHADKRFELKTEEEFVENNKFWDTPRRKAQDATTKS